MRRKEKEKKKGKKRQGKAKSGQRRGENVCARGVLLPPPSLSKESFSVSFLFFTKKRANTGCGHQNFRRIDFPPFQNHILPSCARSLLGRNLCKGHYCTVLYTILYSTTKMNFLVKKNNASITYHSAARKRR